MCLFQAPWVQASCNQDPGTLIYKHCQALCLHWHIGTDFSCGVASVY